MKLTFEQWLEKQDISPISPEAHYAEEAWAASRYSIEIELPFLFPAYRQEVVAVLEAAGLKVKPDGN